LSIKHFIFLAVCVITGCSNPVGSIDESGGNGGGSNNFLMLKPNRILYEIDKSDTFSRASDFQAYTSDGGSLRLINPLDSSLGIEIIAAPELVGNQTSESVTDTYKLPKLPGRYKVKGTYFGKTDEYSIQVEGSLSDPGDEYDFGGIKWLED